MGHMIKELPWCTIDIDTTAGKIVLQERWQYTWVVAPPYQRWTPVEMQNFHQRVDHEIWAAWSNRAFFSIAGTSAFAKRFSGGSVPVVMDVRRVLAKPHWNVFVTKVPEGVTHFSSTNWIARTLRLDSYDIVPRVRCLGPVKAVCMTQMPVTHEFGHAIGNSKFVGRDGDEYPSRSPHSTDFDSIMNRGLELRNRHFEHLLTVINGVIADTTFTLGRLE
jgi:hypothetical protein